jgi:hypothetical protein
VAEEFARVRSAAVQGLRGRARCTQAAFTSYLRWDAGMVALWDNRTAIHLGPNGYDSYRREGYRTTTVRRKPAMVANGRIECGKSRAPHRYGTKGLSMKDDLAAANVNRSYQLAASSIAIFTFVLFFLYPRFVSGDVEALPFQATLIVMGVATFSFAFASFYYYGASLGGLIDDAERIGYFHRADCIWLLGCVLMFLAPSLILFTVRLLAAASAWFALWLVYLLFVIRNFPRVQTRRKT